MIDAGQPAPDFTTPDSSGQTVTLSAFRGKERVVLYFFPKCFTPGCDIEAQGFRDEFPKFQAGQARIFGVSTDAADVAQAFRKKFNLPFEILPDPDQKLSKLYGVLTLLGYAKRVTFLIGLDGKVEEVVESMRPSPHVEGALRRVGGAPAGH